MNTMDDSDASSSDMEELESLYTETGIDKWHRLPGETDFFQGDGRPDTKFLALGSNAKLPVFDEITGWMKRFNKIPPDEVFRGRAGLHPEDAEKNFAAAEKRFGFDIPLRGLDRDAKDREFYDRWAETLEFRWNHDFADLRLRRAKNHGWKWRLIRIRPDGAIVVSPFIKPAHKPYRERGLKSTDVSRNRIPPHVLLDTMREQAQARWRGMPITDKEEKDDEMLLRQIHYIEGLKNNYGFMGEMICGMAADTGSGVRILVIGFLSCYVLLFSYGPLAMLPYLSEFLIAVLPLQATLRGIVTVANDMNRSAGDPYTEGNVRQWLLYWPFYQLLSFLHGWCYLVRPNWYRYICAWRTLACFCCASPMFSDHYIHPPDYKISRRRLLQLIWRERGARLAQEAIVFQAEKPKTAISTKGPQSGRGHNGGSRFDPREHAKMLLNEARVLHGLIEETWFGGEVPTKKQQSMGGTALREAIHAVDQMLEDASPMEKWDAEKRKKFEEACSDLERRIGKTYTSTRSRGGAEAFVMHLKNLYQASDEKIGEYLHALSVERGIVASRRNGAKKAREDAVFRREHANAQRQATTDKSGKEIVAQEKPFTDPGYKYDPEKSMVGLSHELNEMMKKAAKGDKDAIKQLKKDPAYVDKISKAGYGQGDWKARVPWETTKFAPNAAFSEDVTGMILDEKRHPGTGLLQTA